MNRANIMPTELRLATILLIVSPSLGFTQEAQPIAAPDTITIYLDTDLGTRKKGAAKILTQSHRDFAAKGYRFTDLQIYIEDGDQEGFFVTYTKEGPSPLLSAEMHLPD